MLGLILLSKNNVYVRDDRKLPERPEFDKGLLTAFITGQTVSYSAYKLLPPSMKALCYVSDVASSKAPVTIRELAKAHILLIVRSLDEAPGKKFRLDKFKCVVKAKGIEVWQRINS